MSRLHVMQTRVRVADAICELATDLEEAFEELYHIDKLIKLVADDITGVTDDYDVLPLIVDIMNIREVVAHWEQASTFEQPLRNRNIMAGHSRQLEDHRQRVKGLLGET